MLYSARALFSVGLSVALYYIPDTLSGDEQAEFYRDLDLYLSLSNAVNAYDAEVAAAEQAAREKEQYAAYRRAMMQKYRPETLSAMGLDGRGTSESAIIQMNNNIDNYVSGAMSEKNAAQSDALRQYQQLAAEIMQERNAQNLQNAQAEAEQTLENLTLKVQSYLDGEGLYTREEIIQAVNDANVSDEDKDTFARMLNERYDAESGTVSNRVLKIDIGKTSSEELIKNGYALLTPTAFDVASIEELFGDTDLETQVKTGDIKKNDVVELAVQGEKVYLIYAGNGRFLILTDTGSTQNSANDNTVTDQSLIHQLDEAFKQQNSNYLLPGDSELSGAGNPYVSLAGKTYQKVGDQWFVVADS